MVDLDLRPERRDGIVAAVVDALRAAIPGGECQLRGSLATGRADRFSDIDLLWTVPEDSLRLAVESALAVLATVAPVASVRSDPELLHSTTGRLLFVRFAGLPLFWRVDLEIRSRRANTEVGASIDVEALRDETDWSPGASAAANAVAAIKAIVRGQLEDATGLLERGFTRVGGTFESRESWLDAVTRLAWSAAAVDPTVGAFAKEISELAEGLLASGTV